MRHKKTQNLLSAFLDGELKEKQRASIENHLKSCEKCRKEFEKIQNLDNFTLKMKEEVPKEDYWNSFPTRIRSEIQEKIQASSHHDFKMFKDSQIKGDEQIGLKALVFPLSLTAHAFLVALMIVMPLLKP